jgi:hypothetical protein
LEEILRAESHLAVEALVQMALDQIEIRAFEFPACNPSEPSLLSAMSAT